MQPLSYTPSKKQQGQEPPFQRVESSLSLRGIITFHRRNGDLAPNQKSTSPIFAAPDQGDQRGAPLPHLINECGTARGKVRRFMYLGIVFVKSVSSDIYSLTTLSEQGISYS